MQVATGSRNLLWEKECQWLSVVVASVDTTEWPQSFFTSGAMRLHASSKVHFIANILIVDLCNAGCAETE